MTDACLQVTSSSLQQLLELPALAELEVGEHFKLDDASDDERRCRQHDDRTHDQFPAALRDLRALTKSAGRNLVIMSSDDAWSAELLGIGF